MAVRLQSLQGHTTPDIRGNAIYVEELELRTRGDCEELQAMYQQKLTEHNSLSVAITDLIGEEQQSLVDALKDAEIFGAKLEYELTALVYKVEDVEDSVGDFERQVCELEERARELQAHETRADSWMWRLLTRQE